MRDCVGIIGGVLKLVAGLVFAQGAIPMLGGGSWDGYKGIISLPGECCRGISVG